MRVQQADEPGEDLTLSLHAAAPGRLRLRAPALRGDRPAARRLRSRLAAALAGADVDLDIRAATGSIIVRFPAAVPADEVTARVAAALRAPEPESPAPQPARVEVEGRPRRDRQAPPAAPPSSAGPAWHARPLAEILQELGLAGADGLATAEARRRLRTDGANALPVYRPQSALALLARQFGGLPVKMLAASAGLSAATGGVADAVATLAVVAVNGTFGYLTEGAAERTIGRLTATAEETARVLRDGAPAEVAVREIVAGDRLILAPGRQIPADARILEGNDLLIDESALTGESVPVEKAPADALPAAAPLAERRNLVHAGTLVAAGTGEALVVATGARTEAAGVQLLSEGSERPRAPIEEELDRLGVQLVKLCLAACGLFFAAGLVRGYRLPLMLRDTLALAVASVPEGLPAVATTTLALGLRRLERKGILIRRLDAVESLGALQTICLDKTGTLTANRMQVTAVAAGRSELDADAFAESRDRVFRALVEVAALNSDAELENGVVTRSSGTERALLEFAQAAGADVARLRDDWRHVATSQRSERRRFMTTVHENAAGARRILVKGAPDDLLARSAWRLTGGGRRPLSQADRQRIRAQNDRLSARPSRVLAFARADAEPDGDGEISNLTWIGLAGMTDPVRPGARDFIAALHRAGIETVLITGDQGATAEAVARKLDISAGRPLQVMDSAHLETLDPRLLAGLAARTHVFSRVNPRQKLLIVRALQASGRVVGMTGDGVNDGPALKAANVGIAMGRSGTELARNVANVLIADDDLPTLIEAIAQGRSIYRNIRRSLEFLVTTNLSEIAVEMLEAIHGPGELDTPMELLWINLASDVAPGIGLALADPDPDVMARPPRLPGEPIIPQEDFRRMGGDSAVIAAAALASHFVGLARYGPGARTRGMTFLALSLGQLLYTLGCQRRDPRKLHFSRLLENRTLDAALLASIGFAVLPFLSRRLGRLLGVAPLGRSDTLVALAAAAVPLARILAVRGLDFSRGEAEITKETGRTPCATSS